MAEIRREITIDCTGTPGNETWTADPAPTDAEPLVDELRKWSGLAEAVGEMGKSVKVIVVREAP